MTLRKKIIYSILFLVILLITNLYTYKVADEKAQLKAFMVEVGMDAILLKALDNNRTDLVKNILTWSSRGLFYDVGKYGDAERYLPMCKRIDKNMIDLLERNGVFKDTNTSDIELKEANRLRNLGIEKIKKLCNIK